ncbi:MAG: hypothetical protein CSA62_09505 [Planctomycetota bacterium]|nr:MAG: hypothetical protein CSA62_09505 [Planctomycetota bacterium]
MASFAPALAPILLLGACALLPQQEKLRPVAINSYLADPRDMIAVRRIVVLPVAGENVPSTLRKHLQHSLERSIAETQRFQVVPLPNVSDNDRELLRSEARGKLSIDSLVSLAKRYQIDGAVLCRVHAFQPYKPPILGLQTQLVSIHSGDTVWAADATYDSSIKRVQLDLRHYYETELAETESLHEWELLCLSPRLYGSYVVHRIVGTLASR